MVALCLPANAGVVTDKMNIGLGAEADDRPVVVLTKATRNQPRTDAGRRPTSWIKRQRVVAKQVMAKLTRFDVPRRMFPNVLGQHIRLFRAIVLLYDRRAVVRPLKTDPIEM